LDYHQNMEKYCQVKNRLFASLRDPKQKTRKKYSLTAIVNADDPFSQQILKDCKAPVMTYGIDNPADIMAVDIKMSGSGSKFTLKYKGEETPISLPLIGRFNIYNGLAAIACGISQNMPLNAIAETVKTFPFVPGRLEKISNPQGLKIFVDFAHTPD